MPGFFISNIRCNSKLNNSNSIDCFFETIHSEIYTVCRNTINKFMLDKCLKENSDYIVVLEGVLLNKSELFFTYSVSDVFSLLLEMYKKNGETFFKDFRGSFSGALFIKKERKWIVFTNHYGDSTLYYYFNQGVFLVGSQINYILDTLKLNKFDFTINELAVESILSYGYLSEEYTYAREINRILPGHYLVFKENQQIEVKRYFFIRKDKGNLNSKNEEQLIDNLDFLFRKAVKLEYEKDEEYGYMHFSQLSGGLDSRMALWVAKELGFNNITCMTYSQSNSLDEIIAKKISKYLNINLLFWPLDTANHLVHIDDSISMNFGTANYAAPGAVTNILNLIDIRKFGLLHTGQLGDVVISSFLRSKDELKDMSIGGNESDLIIYPHEFQRRFIDREDYLMFVRGFMGCLSSHLFIRNYTEVASPFLNIDLFDFCMSIPVELRANHYIYKKWILTKYPKAAEFIWERTGRRIDNDNSISFAKRLNSIILDPKRVLKKFLRIKYSPKWYTGMNPFDKWWKENVFFRESIENYFFEKISGVDNSLHIKELINYLYKNGNTNDKLLAITAISAISYYFKDNQEDR